MQASDLYGTLVGKEAALICGGQDTIEHLKALPEDCYVVAVNHHSVDLPIKVDMAVAMDVSPHKDGRMAMYDKDVIIVGRRDGRDVNIEREEWFPNVPGQSSYKAFALLKKMQPSKIYVVGMDCCTGGKTHWHGREQWKQSGNQVVMCKKYWQELSRGIETVFLKPLEHI